MYKRSVKMALYIEDCSIIRVSLFLECEMNQKTRNFHWIRDAHRNRNHPYSPLLSQFKHKGHENEKSYFQDLEFLDSWFKCTKAVKSWTPKALQHNNTSMTDMRRREGKERRRSTIILSHTNPPLFTNRAHFIFSGKHSPFSVRVHECVCGHTDED